MYASVFVPIVNTRLVYRHTCSTCTYLYVCCETHDTNLIIWIDSHAMQNVTPLQWDSGPQFAWASETFKFRPPALRKHGCTCCASMGPAKVCCGVNNLIEHARKKHEVFYSRVHLYVTTHINVSPCTINNTNQISTSADAYICDLKSSLYMAANTRLYTKLPNILGICRLGKCLADTIQFNHQDWSLVCRPSRMP